MDSERQIQWKRLQILRITVGKDILAQTLVPVQQLKGEA